MGYRSEVIIGIHKGLSETLQAFSLDEGEPFADHFTLRDTRDDMEIWTADYIKWYTMFDKHINNIVFFIKCMEEDGFIVCIGEENEIHSEIGDWQDYIHIHTTWS